MEVTKILPDVIRDGESQVELWYPVAKRPFETVVAFSSFVPIIFYYLHKIEEWRLVFQQCKVCYNYFVASKRLYGLALFAFYAVSDGLFAILTNPTRALRASLFVLNPLLQLALTGAT